ncbi:MAG: type I methionyl aminopeptidase [Archangium sp.]|nr:type I methionyl aminopeptidase [Archangium sp.]
MSLPRPNEICWCGSGEKYKRCHKDADAAFLKAERVTLEANRIVPGTISPRRPVPAAIPRPDYAVTGIPSKGSGRLVRTAEEMVRLRKACAAAAKVLRMTGEQVKPGVTSDELDAFAHELIISMGAYPSPLNYRGFPKSICTSPNEVICHGIPDSRALREGDVVNLDITVFLEGMHGDTNATFFAGEPDEDSRRLVRVTHECMMRGIEAVKPGRPVNDIGRAIELHATANGYGVVRSYCGHGIGDVFHAALQIPHYFDAKSTTRMEPGMTFTIEPMITMGSHREVHWDDEWTVVTDDLRRTAQFEHTVVVTDTGAEILTREV